MSSVGLSSIFATISAAISPPSTAATSQLATRFWWSFGKLVILRADHASGRWVVTVDGKSVYDSNDLEIKFQVGGQSAHIEIIDFPGGTLFLS
jgi:hypothetical protein